MIARAALASGLLVGTAVADTGPMHLKPAAKRGVPRLGRTATACREDQQLVTQRRVVGQVEVLVLHDCGIKTPTTSIMIHNARGWFESGLGLYENRVSDPGRGESKTWLVRERVDIGDLADGSPALLHVLELAWWERTPCDGGSCGVRIERGRELAFQVCTVDDTPACDLWSLPCPGGICPTARLAAGTVSAGDERIEVGR